MTFEISAPILISICCLSTCGLLGAFISYKEKTCAGIILVGGLIGGFTGIFGYVITADVIQARAAEISAKAHLETMPEDWRGLHRLLKETESSVQMQKIYVTAFVKNKTEPEISIRAYLAFCSTAANDDDENWKRWLAGELMPFAIIDVNAAIGELE